MATSEQTNESEDAGPAVELTCAVQANRVNTIVIPEVLPAYIRLLILDEYEDPMANVDYRLEDGEGQIWHESKTDGEGLIDHDDVYLDDYVLVLGGFRSPIAAVSDAEERCTVFLPELGYLRLMVIDPAEQPMVNIPYEIKVDGCSVFSGKTKEGGAISWDLVPIDDYELCIGSGPIKVPAVGNEEEIVSVFISVIEEDDKEEDDRDEWS